MFRSLPPREAPGICISCFSYISYFFINCRASAPSPIIRSRICAQAQASQDPMAVQVVADFEAGVDRFEKKVHDLKLSRTIAIQTAPQIRLIQNNDKALIDRVQTAIYSTIPLWKNQLVIALGLQSQRRVLDMQRAVSDTTNELLKRNAEMLKANTLETAAENERGIVDIDTVKKVNEDLIATIEETVKIQRDGRAKRAAAEICRKIGIEYDAGSCCCV